MRRLAKKRGARRAGASVLRKRQKGERRADAPSCKKTKGERRRCGAPPLSLVCPRSEHAGRSHRIFQSFRTEISNLSPFVKHTFSRASPAYSAFAVKKSSTSGRSSSAKWELSTEYACFLVFRISLFIRFSPSFGVRNSIYHFSDIVKENSAGKNTLPAASCLCLSFFVERAFCAVDGRVCCLFFRGVL